MCLSGFFFFLIYLSKFIALQRKIYDFLSLKNAQMTFISSRYALAHGRQNDWSVGRTTHAQHEEWTSYRHTKTKYQYHIQEISETFLHMKRNWFCHRVWIELSALKGSVLFGLEAHISLHLYLIVEWHSIEDQPVSEIRAEISRDIILKLHPGATSIGTT